MSQLERMDFHDMELLGLKTRYLGLTLSQLERMHFHDMELPVRAAPHGLSRTPGPRNPPLLSTWLDTGEKWTLLWTLDPQIQGGEPATAGTMDSRMYNNNNILAIIIAP